MRLLLFWRVGFMPRVALQFTVNLWGLLQHVSTEYSAGGCVFMIYWIKKICM